LPRPAYLCLSRAGETGREGVIFPPQICGGRVMELNWGGPPNKAFNIHLFFSLLAEQKLFNICLNFQLPAEQKRAFIPLSILTFV
jgi:hypothetical protein